MNRAAVFYALASAILFGLSAPLAKLLLGSIDPWLLAGLLYLGSGLGLAILHLAAAPWRNRAEAPLTRRDMPWLAAAILAGGVIAPVLLMLGLARTDGATASLLLTSEGAATALLAWFAFRENVDRRIAAGMLLIVAGAALLAWPTGTDLGHLTGAPLVVAACVVWGIDNNLTRKVALADPLQVAMLKGLVAGSVNLALALARGATLPALPGLGAALLVGFLGYGVSLVLFVLALRHLGTARTGAYFSTAPFLGAMLAVPLLGDAVTIQLVVAGGLMALGVWLHLTERHVHEHDHPALAHSHRHVHDLHHRHGHDPQDPPGEPHSHRHAHVRLRHAHAHMPDSHHRHGH
ncbi:DMT family transporter [Ferrovibrio xuzhouensis]|uniref:EamA family transporter n=1 Tax=Ferrovibrio xuzhouensis TaxID=1576914 RepID=A0ABV7VEY6_9PROT